MRTILVLAQHPDLVQAVQRSLNPEHYRIDECTSLDDAEPLLTRGVVDACIVDAAEMGVQGIWLLEKMHRRFPKCPVLAFAGHGPWEWEEEAYLQGVTLVL